MLDLLLWWAQAASGAWILVSSLPLCPKLLFLLCVVEKKGARPPLSTRGDASHGRLGEGRRGASLFPGSPGLVQPGTAIAGAWESGRCDTGHLSAGFPEAVFWVRAEDFRSVKK